MPNVKPAVAELTLSESDGVLCLHFGSPWVQGAMQVDDPHRLLLDYTHNMMAGLLLQPAPRRFLQLGIGAASLTKAAYKLFPNASIVAVDNSPAVISSATSNFKCPKPNKRLTLVCADAQDYVTDCKEQFDMIQVDIYDAQAAAPVYGSLRFYKRCAARLSPGGVFAVNLFGYKAQLAQQLVRLAQAFEGQIYPLPPTPAGNVVVLATHLQAPVVELKELRKRAVFWRDTEGWMTRQWVNALA